MAAFLLFRTIFKLFENHSQIPYFMFQSCMSKSKLISAFYLLFILLFSFAYYSNAQTSASAVNFLNYQRSFPRINEIMKRKEDTLMKQFSQKGLTWPAKYVYLRSFKYDSEIELWVKSKKEEKYKLFKTYKICALAGTLGPKRMAGDYQVPEGFYYITEFNPRSLYHLSLELNYPNASDKLLSDLSQPGGEIYIHGSCVTTGCIPITDEQIEELYIIAAHAKDLGQDFIPVHIFPVNFKNQRSVGYLNKYLQNFSENTSFEKNMKNAFFYFEKYRQLPLVLVNNKGGYVTEEVSLSEPVAEVKQKKKIFHAPQPIKDDDLPKVVEKLPLFPGGNDAFQDFITKLGKDEMKDLETGQSKTFVLIEYIIDKDGTPVYSRVIRGGNDEMNEKLESAFMKMPQWTPASVSGKKVPIKLKQTIMVGVDQ
jgi:murein L,D-transpeptidase YafK